MFTVEFEYDEFVVTLVDDTAKLEDTTVIINDDVVYIRQWNPRRAKYDLINLTPKMFEELQQAMNQPEGAYFIEVTKNV
jgi:hypothetical protein